MDVSQHVKALQVPELTVLRRSRIARLLFGETQTYRGRILSHAEWLPYEREFAELTRRHRDGGEDTLDLLHDTWGRYLDALGIPARVVFGLPTGVVVEVMQEFLRLQAIALQKGEPNN